MGVVKIKMAVPSPKDVRFHAELLEIEGFSPGAAEFINILLNFPIVIFLRRALVWKL